MRVLFTSTPGWGHIHPMVPLAQAFQARGDEVAWAVPAEVVPRLEEARFQVFAAGLGTAEAYAEVIRQFPEFEALREGRDNRRRGFPMLFGSARAAPMLSDLEPVVSDWDPSLLIHEQSELAGPIAATSAGIPYLTHSFGELVQPENLDADALGVAPLWEAAGLEPPAFGGCYAHMYLDIYPASLHSADMTHVPFIQPIRPVAFATGQPEPLPEWIGGDSVPLVYMTFGTVFNDNPDVIRTVVEGVRALPVRVLVTVGPHADPATLGDQPENVHVERYVPQTQLLPHCAVVVSHAGSGTFLASLSEALPQVCVPQGADQFANAEACVRGGVDRTLVPAEMTAENVRAATEEVLSDKQFRLAAEKVQAEIASMPDPAEVADLLATRLVTQPGGT